jgi:hypothetical protein
MSVRLPAYGAPEAKGEYELLAPTGDLAVVLLYLMLNLWFWLMFQSILARNLVEGLSLE